MRKALVKQELKKWLNKYIDGDLEIKFGSDFEYNNEDGDSITLGEYETYKENEQTEFMNLQKELGGDLDIITLSFLHELGHYHTHGDFNEKQEYQDNIIRLAIYNVLENSGDYDLRSDVIKEYYKLPQEIKATKWGIDFSKKHKKATRELTKALLAE